MSILHNKTKIKTDFLIFYLLWPIIIVPKEIQFVGITLVLVYLLRRHKLNFDVLSYFMLAFITIYLFSIIVNLIGNSYELERIFATVNTFSIWVCSLFFYLIFKVIPLDLDHLKKITFINYCILIILWICSIIVYFITKFPRFEMLNRELYYTEWFGNMQVIRFVGFMDYPNLIIMFFMFFYPLFLSYLKYFKNHILKILLMILGILPIIGSFSRSGYVIMLTYLLIVSIYFTYTSMNRNLFIAISFFSLSIFSLMIFYTNAYNEAVSIFQELLNAREGSNVSRIYLMVESIKITLVESPIIGMGVKVTSLIGYPLGSHSTYVGLFYRTGIAGVILGLLIFVIITVKILFTRVGIDKTVIKISILMMPLLFIFEDIDGTNWLMIMYFLLVATIFNKTTIVYKESRI